MEKPFTAYQGDEPYIFVSYAHEDAERVYPELEWLRRQGFNVWYDEGISPGEVWREGLARAIKDASLFLFYVTPNSVASQHCLREVNFRQEDDRAFLAVHLEATQLPDGLRLSISDRQAILAHELSRTDFQDKLRQTLASFIPIEPQSPPAEGILPDIPKTARHSLLGYALIALSVLVVGVLFLAWPRTPPREGPQVEQDVSAETPAAKSIAVLAFDNMSDDPQMNYLGDGIAEELMNALYQGGLRVASRTDAFSFKGANVRTKDIGGELGVETVLEGSVRRSGDQLRITAQLINVADGFHLWSAVYERPMGDLFDIQDAIVRDVSRELLGTLGVAPSTADLAGTRNMRAYEMFMLGRYENQSDTPEAIERAIGHYEEAIRLDPDFRQPYASLARAYSRQTIFTGERTEAQRRIAQIQREFERREATWRDEPEWSRSLYEISVVTWDPDGMERALAADIRVRRTDPAVPDPLHWDPYFFYAALLGQARLHRDAVAYAQAGGPSAELMAGSYFALGELERAMDEIHRGSRTLSFQVVGPFIHGSLLAMAGRVDDARELLNDPGLVSPYRDYLRWVIAFRAGDLESAGAILEALEAADVSPTVLGVFRLQIGDVDAGFRHLQRAIEQHDEILLYLSTLELALPAHILIDPRYLEVREATGFTVAWAEELCRRAATLTPVTGIEMSCLADQRNR